MPSKLARQLLKNGYVESLHSRLAAHLSLGNKATIPRGSDSANRYRHNRRLDGASVSSECGRTGEGSGPYRARSCEDLEVRRRGREQAAGSLTGKPQQEALVIGKYLELVRTLRNVALDFDHRDPDTLLLRVTATRFDRRLMHSLRVRKRTVGTRTTPCVVRLPYGRSGGGVMARRFSCC